MSTIPEQKALRLGKTARAVCAYLQRTGGASCREVAEGICANPNTIKNMLQELERKGFVERRGHYRGQFVRTMKALPPECESVPRRPRAPAGPGWPPCDPVVERAMRAMALCMRPPDLNDRNSRC
ncbi:FeoC-like transcriptional regulator [Burkholderia cepacia]|uniref:FeoC-like transcriptional regulator n=1 Tax=Burkholderia cepacia TaxID=292 RepID=UPI001CF2B56C|nr:FeoC-like transcriptional regulator [Burkholderia cepacia]